MIKTAYIQQMYSILSRLCVKYGYGNVAAGMIAQSIQEGWNSGLASKYYNYWGMKAGSSYKGKIVAMNNKAGNDPAVYRVYTSMEEGCEGYFEFLSYPRYKSLKSCVSDTDYLDKIGPCGWNSNPGYGNRCKSHLNEVYTALGNVGTQTSVSYDEQKPILRYGSSGAYVLAWQKYLNLMGYNLAEDGIFGKDTQAAIIKYQKSKGLTADGIVGAKTWASAGK